MATTTADVTLLQILNKGNLNTLGLALAKMKLGNMNAAVKLTVTGLTAAGSFDITSTTIRDAANTGSITGLERVASDLLPPISVVKTLRVTASGTANSVGSYAMTDAGGTAVSPMAGTNVGLAKISDDGTTISFPSTVTAFILEYVPRSAVDMTTVWQSPV